MKLMKLIPTVLIVLSLSIFQSCGNSESGNSSLDIPGVDGPKIHLVGDQLLISMVFENISVEGGLRYPIPKYNRSYIEVSPDFESAGTLMVFTVDLDDIFKGNVNRLDPQTLPGGRPLPGVSSGALPAVAFTIPKWENVSVYIGPSVFGVFVPVKLKAQGAILTARYKADSVSGNISLVSADSNGENSGFLLLLNITKNLEKALKYTAKKY